MPQLRESQENKFPERLAQKLFPKLEAISKYKSIDTREKGLIRRTKAEFEALPKNEQTPKNRKKKVKEASIIDIALEAYMELLKQYELPTTENGLKVWSGSRQASKLYEELSKLKTEDDGLQRRMKASIELFAHYLNVHCSPHRKIYNDSYNEKIQERSEAENRRQVDLTEHLKLAHTLLRRAEKGDILKRECYDLACALALVTGRRQAEIMSSGKFSYHSEYELVFSGQLKSKGKGADEKTDSNGVPLSEKEHIIGTLVPAELVLHGLRILETHGRRIDDHTKVNGLFGRYLSEAVAENWKVDDEFTFHGFRGLYVEAEMHNKNIDPKSYSNFARKALCDESKGAVASYIRFDLVEGSLTKIIDTDFTPYYSTLVEAS